MARRRYPSGEQPPRDVYFEHRIMREMLASLNMRPLIRELETISTERIGLCSCRFIDFYEKVPDFPIILMTKFLERSQRSISIYRAFSLDKNPLYEEWKSFDVGPFRGAGAIADSKGVIVPAPGSLLGLVIHNWIPGHSTLGGFYQYLDQSGKTIVIEPIRRLILKLRDFYGLYM